VSDILDVTAVPAAPEGPSPLLAACLRVCQVSYQPLEFIAEAVHFLPAVDQPGKWKVLWGPSESRFDANLAVVAGYYLDRRPGTPYVVVVGLRGTDVDVQNPVGVVYQIWEDMDAALQTEFHLTGGFIANGTSDALGTIQGLTDPTSGRTMSAFLIDFYNGLAAPRPPVVVTGHSLGGCLATVVMPWLKSALRQVTPAPEFSAYTFAAPTAGDQAFATGLARQGVVVSVHNSLDVATFAWEDFGGMKSVYKTSGLPVPLYVELAIDGFAEVLRLAGATYAQPAQALRLPGKFDKTYGTSWADQALFQHHTTTYAALLGLPALDTPREAGSRRKRGAPGRGAVLAAQGAGGV